MATDKRACGALPDVCLTTFLLSWVWSFWQQFLQRLQAFILLPFILSSNPVHWPGHCSYIRILGQFLWSLLNISSTYLSLSDNTIHNIYYTVCISSFLYSVQVEYKFSLLEKFILVFFFILVFWVFNICLWHLFYVLE